MATVFKIEKGLLALSLVGDTDQSAWQAPGGLTVDTATVADYLTGGGDFSCQVTSGQLVASPNTTDDTTPATFCSPEITTTSVGVTSYTLDASILQDPNVAAGISRYLFEHDTELAYFFLGLDDVNPPRAIGRVRLVAGAFGGDARVTLTADLSLPVERKPDIEFGDATSSVVITGAGGASIAITGVTAGTPGSFAPVDATVPPTLAALKGDAVVGDSGSNAPTTAWTTGQFVNLGTGTAHWDGDEWIAGSAP